MPYAVPPLLVQPAQLIERAQVSPSLGLAFHGDAASIAKLQDAAAQKGVQLTEPQDDGGGGQVVRVAPGQDFAAVMALATAAQNGAFGSIRTEVAPAVGAAR